MRLDTAATAEIAAHRDVHATTRRPISSGLEDILHQVFPVLDHGFIRIVDYMGNDSSIVQAARVSYGRGTKKSSEDQGLINYLMQHQHTTPFEMAEIKIHVKLPIFVARQWIRHRTASVNEYSARYSVLDREYYIPEPDRLASQSSLNRQGAGAQLTGEEARHVLTLLKQDATSSYSHYLDLLNEDSDGRLVSPRRLGLARELARMTLSVNFYTQWYWKVDLHNFMRFLHLRADQHAQYEIRAYAEVLLDILARWVPITCQAFRNYQFGAMTLSAQAIDLIRDRLSGKHTMPEDVGINRREWKTLTETFGLD